MGPTAYELPDDLGVELALASILVLIRGMSVATAAAILARFAICW